MQLAHFPGGASHSIAHHRAGPSLHRAPQKLFPCHGFHSTEVESYWTDCFFKDRHWMMLCHSEMWPFFGRRNYKEPRAVPHREFSKELGSCLPWKKSARASRQLTAHCSPKHSLGCRGQGQRAPCLGSTLCPKGCAALLWEQGKERRGRKRIPKIKQKRKTWPEQYTSS